MSDELADQQQLVLKVATRRQPALIAGQTVSADQWFAALKATAMLVRLGVPEVLPLLDGSPDGRGALAAEAAAGQRWNRAGPMGRFGMAPRTALAAAGLLTVALEVAAADGESELVARLMPLAAAARMRWKERRPDPLTQMDLPSVFTAALGAVLGGQARRESGGLLV